MSNNTIAFEVTPLEAALILQALEGTPDSCSMTMERARVRVLELLKEVIC